MLGNARHQQPMTDPVPNPAPGPSEEKDEPSQGPNLVLIYGLIGLALVLAIGFAVLIVMPFYLRR
jgi:hypothetical protein